MANATAQSADHIVSFFQMLRTELGFYIGCLNLKQKLEGLGVRICSPCCGTLRPARAVVLRTLRRLPGLEHETARSSATT